MKLDEFVTQRLTAFRDRTAMWGSAEAVELQAIQLLELELQTFAPAALDQAPGAVFEAYVEKIRETYPGGPTQPLHAIVFGTAFGAELFRLCSSLRTELRSRYAVRSPAALGPPDFLTTPDFTRAASNVRNDSLGDWLGDPWGYPELDDELGIASAALAEMESGSVQEVLLLDVPKSRYDSRPAVLLPIATRVAYQALVDHCSVPLVGQLADEVFGWRLSRVAPVAGAYEDNGEEWVKFCARSNALGAKYKYVLRTDIRSFFSTVRADAVKRVLEHVDSPAIPHLANLLERFALIPSRSGLPQRCLGSSILSQAILAPVDAQLSSATGPWCRWMDDYAVFSDSYDSLATTLRSLEQALSPIGLALNATKTTISETAERETLLETIAGAVQEVPAPSVVPMGIKLSHVRRVDDAKIRQMVDEVATEPQQAPRTKLSFLAAALRKGHDVDLVRKLASASEELPHGADRLADLIRKSGLSGERSGWYVDFAKAHPGAAEWATSAWGMMFDANRPADDAVSNMFFSTVADRQGPPSLIPLAACRLSQWGVPNQKRALAELGDSGQTQFQRRAGLLALAQQGSLSKELVRKAKLAVPQLEYAAERVAAGMLDRHYR